jgi:DNA-binding MarR family transcriptional regulator
MLPHEFEYLWQLKACGPLTAGEMAAIRNRPIRRLYETTGRQVSNQLRRLVAAGLIKGDGDRQQIYRLTDAGREYVDA